MGVTPEAPPTHSQRIGARSRRTLAASSSEMCHDAPRQPTRERERTRSGPSASDSPWEPVSFTAPWIEQQPTPHARACNRLRGRTGRPPAPWTWRSTSVGSIARRHTRHGRPVPRWDLDTPSTTGKRACSSRTRICCLNCSSEREDVVMGLRLLPLELPGREAPDVGVECVSGGVAVVLELHLGLHLVLPHRQPAHRASIANAGGAPGTIRSAAGELTTLDGYSGFLAKDGLVGHVGFLSTRCSESTTHRHSSSRRAKPNAKG